MRQPAKKPAAPKPRSNTQSRGQCLCGAVAFEIDVPARWAWHDHGAASRTAHGAAYATYVGSYKSRFRILKGEAQLTRYVEANGAARSFCAKCGTPVAYERAHAKTMINVPRALFVTRTGREPLYHVAIAELQDWAYTGAPLAPLKGFPGVVWERRKQKKKAATAADSLFD